MAMKERRAVAFAERQGRELELRYTGRPKGIAIERCVLTGLRQRRHDVAERTERASSHVQRAAGKSLRRKTAARGFEQGGARFEREGEGAATHFHPLDALGDRRARLLDAAHHVPAGFIFDAFSSREPVPASLENALVRSSRPRASSSSRTSRFGILP